MIGFFRKKKEPPPPPTEIGASTSFEGEVESKREVILAGRLTGSVSSSAAVETREGSSLEGKVSAPLVRIEGAFRGEVKAARLLHIGASASVEGELRTPRLKVEKGAYVSGRSGA